MRKSHIYGHMMTAASGAPWHNHLEGVNHPKPTGSLEPPGAPDVADSLGTIGRRAQSSLTTCKNNAEQQDADIQYTVSKLHRP